MNRRGHLMILAAVVLLAGCGTGDDGDGNGVAEAVSDSLRLNPPTADLNDLRVGPRDEQNVTMVFEIRVHNPYPMVVEVRRFKYRISSGLEPFLAGDVKLQTTVASDATETFWITDRVPMYAFNEAVEELRQVETIDYNGEFELTVVSVEMGAMDIKFEKTGRLELPGRAEPMEIDMRKIIQEKSERPFI